jgi:hypothetical protein
MSAHAVTLSISEAGVSSLPLSTCHALSDCHSRLRTDLGSKSAHDDELPIAQAYRRGRPPPHKFPVGDVQQPSAAGYHRLYADQLRRLGDGRFGCSGNRIDVPNQFRMRVRETASCGSSETNPAPGSLSTRSRQEIRPRSLSTVTTLTDIYVVPGIVVCTFPTVEPHPTTVIPSCVSTLGICL